MSAVRPPATLDHCLDRALGYRGTMRSLLITGAGGWVGRVAARMTLDARPLLLSRSPRRLSIDGRTLNSFAMSALETWAPKGRALVIHAGFPTQEQVEVLGDSAYASGVSDLRRAMGRALDRLGPVDMVYLSSGAATQVEAGVPVAPRTAMYGRAKVDDEREFTAQVTRNGGRLCVVRAYALSGPYMTKPETYALGNMVLQGLRHRTVEVKAARPVRRSYMVIEDMLRVAISAVDALPQASHVTFETAGEVVEMGELASRVLAVLGCDPGSVVRHEFDPDAPADDYLGDPDVVGHLAAAAGVVPMALDDQIAVTAEWLCAEYGL